MVDEEIGMAKKRSDASRVVEFFLTQPIEVAEALLTIVQEIMKRRRPARAKVATMKKEKAGPTSMTSTRSVPPASAAGGSFYEG